MANVEERVRDIVAGQLGVPEEQVVPEAKFVEDLGADSLDLVELVMAFEEAFDTKIPEEDADKLTSVADAIGYIEAHGEG